MEKLYVVTHDTYAQGLTAGTSDLDDLGSLALGAFAIIDKDPASATFDKVAAISIAVLNIATVPTLSAFQIAYMGNQGLELSPILHSHYTKGINVANAAAAAKICTIGNTTDGGTTYAYHLPATLSANMTAGFVVTNTSKPLHDTSRNRYYTYTLVAGDTDLEITTALIAAVGADPKAIVTAAVAYAGAHDGITLTGKTAGVSYEVSMIGIFKDADLTIGTNYGVGQGLAAQLLDIEASYRVELGDTNVREGDEAFHYTSRIVAGTAYRTAVLLSTTPNQRKPDMEGTNWEQKIILAFPSTSTNTDAAGFALTALNRLLDKVIA